MARTVILTQSGVGSTVWWPVDIHRDPVHIGFGVSVTGTVNYTVQHTFVNTLFTDAAVAAGDIFPHEDVAATTIANDGNYAFPVTGVRITVNSGTGEVIGRFTQAGIRGG